MKKEFFKDLKRDKGFSNVGDKFEKWLNINHFKERSQGSKISENWALIIGNTIDNHTTRVDVRLPKIYLKLDNSSLKEMLYSDSELLITKINDFMGEVVVKEIIFN